MSGEGETVDALTRILVHACRGLARAGEPHRAGRLAADAWVAVRGSYPRPALHLDGVMHQIARIEQEQVTEPMGRPSVPGRPVRKEAIVSSIPAEERVLDVRTEEPRRRHELIFETFTDLPVGQSYVLVNDHDPKPLRYQFEAENAGEFSWRYLAEGPEVWQVRIGRIAAPGVAASS